MSLAFWAPLLNNSLFSLSLSIMQANVCSLQLRVSTQMPGLAPLVLPLAYACSLQDRKQCLLFWAPCLAPPRKFRRLWAHVQPPLPDRLHGRSKENCNLSGASLLPGLLLTPSVTAALPPYLNQAWVTSRDIRAGREGPRATRMDSARRQKPTPLPASAMSDYLVKNFSQLPAGLLCQQPLSLFVTQTP